MNSAKALDVWIVDDDASIRWVLERALKQAGLETRAFEQADAALAALRQGVPDVLVTDIRMPGRSGSRCGGDPREAAAPAGDRDDPHSDLESAVAALPGRCVRIPAQAVRTSTRPSSWCAVPPRRASARRPPRRVAPHPEMLGHAPSMQEVFADRPPVALEHDGAHHGESGTGKESSRVRYTATARAPAKPFIALNTSRSRPTCSSPSFRAREGCVHRRRRAAARPLRAGRCGTLFLDEIGDIVAGAADPPAARAGRGRVLSRGRPAAREGGRAGGRRYPPGPRSARARRLVRETCCTAST